MIKLKLSKTTIVKCYHLSIYFDLALLYNFFRFYFQRLLFLFIHLKNSFSKYLSIFECHLSLVVDNTFQRYMYLHWIDKIKWSVDHLFKQVSDPCLKKKHDWHKHILQYLFPWDHHYLPVAKSNTSITQSIEIISWWYFHLKNGDTFL